MPEHLKTLPEDLNENVHWRNTPAGRKCPLEENTHRRRATHWRKMPMERKLLIGGKCPLGEGLPPDSNRNGLPPCSNGKTNDFQSGLRKWGVPQSNGLAENAVKKSKHLVAKIVDTEGRRDFDKLDRGNRILEMRNTPNKSEIFPARMVFGQVIGGLQKPKLLGV